MSPSELTALERDFIALAHAHQEPPACALSGGPWTTWLVLAGRGAGKTRLGAEWVRALVKGEGPYAEQVHMHIALVGETEHDAREVMIEGPAGLLRASPPGERPAWTPSRRRLEWPSGAVGLCFSAEDPEQLRGPQFDAAWCDELAKWHHADATFDMLQFGLRLGARPRQLVTTTPRPIPLIKRLITDARTAVTRAATQANAAFLSPTFLDEVLARYAGTRLGRQEIDGDIIEDRADALWTRAMIEAARVQEAPPLMRIVIGIDPPASHRDGADLCGIVAAGLSEEGIVYVLADDSRGGLCARRLGASGDRALSQAEGRRAHRRGQPGRRHGERGAAPGGPQRAGARGARHARQVPARRAGSGALRARQGQARRPALGGARRRDVRLRPRRALHRRLARPARRAGVGGDGADVARMGGAKDQEH